MYVPASVGYKSDLTVVHGTSDIGNGSRSIYIIIAI